MTLQELLCGRREEILRHFVDEVRKSDLASASIDRPLLLDGLPAFLDRVVAALSGAQPSLMTEARSSADASGAEHGRQRWKLGYDARELIREYGILQDVILGLFSSEHMALDADQYRVFARHISLGVVEAVGQLSDDRDEAIATHSAEQFAFLAHELRGPLTVALLCMETWQRVTPPSPDSIEDAAESLRRLSRLIDDAIVSARVQSGKQVVGAAITSFDFGAMIADALGAMAPVAAARDVRLVADVTPPGLTVRGDPRLLASALGNLIGNAVKFTHAHTAVIVRARIVDGVLGVHVEDECGGFPPGAMERAFKPFVQLSADRSGFGLGLAIVRQAAEAHGGRLHAEDRAGHGCRFTLEIPQAT